MIEALWSVVFTSNLGSWGGGVMIFDKGRIFGGDSGCFYTGSYIVTGSILDAQITVTHYGYLVSVWLDSESYDLIISGEIAFSKFTISGYKKTCPTQALSVELSRRSELHIPLLLPNVEADQLDSSMAEG